jgi:transcriptional regulator with XRE-family HTH domain
VDFMGGAVDVGLRVASLREKSGWTYRDLEEKTKSAGRRVSVSVLYRIEKGGQKVSVDDLVALCRAFDITPDEMLTSADVLELREGERLLSTLAQAIGTFWASAQAAFVAAAEVGAKKVGHDVREHEIGDYVLNRLQHDLPKPEQVHPEVVSTLSPRLWEVLEAGLMYPARWVDRVSRLEEALVHLEESRTEESRAGLLYGEDSEVVAAHRNAVKAREVYIQALMSYQVMLDEWEASHSATMNGEES